ncbi:MAG TPA: hypothetical protein DCZ01_07115 [Elusimicrobia bacterium]|nr:MAG: hypothetical protein A2X37_04205 [Elusimicrobia bacterium GWA2_66_18]OGR68982.1 MAG: hypothetical protein A2X40_10545 [Elusimicrobia bacterium GWC2_65_9]HAZ08276.1 hypothetical protein [Elusimicrobiota bacterium]
MNAPERLRLLRSLELFEHYPEERLSALAACLEPLRLEDGAPVFAEGSRGDGLYFVVAGRVRIAKRLAAGGEMDLASVGPGDCLGEMALLDDIPRSAGAYAKGRAELLRLKRDDLKRWLESDAQLAMKFFAGLVQVQSRRLRRTSDEVALLYDLSQLLLTPLSGPEELLNCALDRVLPHLEGKWSAEARAYNPFEDEMNLVARRGEALGPDVAEPAPKTPAAESWTDERTLFLVLRAPKRLLALLRFRAQAPLDDAKRAEAARILGAAARLLASALENIDFRAEAALRERLRTRTDGPSL